MNYMIISLINNLKGDDDLVRYYVEPSDGGGIEFAGDTLGQAVDYVNAIGGTVEYVF